LGDFVVLCFELSNIFVLFLDYSVRGLELAFEEIALILESLHSLLLLEHIDLEASTIVNGLKELVLFLDSIFAKLLEHRF
jgi:hypothetical protein